MLEGAKSDEGGRGKPSSGSSRIAKWIEKSLSNRECCDCKTKMKGWGATWVSVNVGAVLCIQCAGIHRQLGVQASRIKSVTLDQWDDHEVDQVQALATHNERINGVYASAGKRSQLPADATMEEREEFIKAKYSYSMAQMDQLADTTKLVNTMMDKPGISPPKRKRTIPVKKRFIDYFAVVGRGAMMNQMKAQESTSPTEMAFQPTILDQFPANFSDFPLPSHIAQFAFPEGFKLATSSEGIDQWCFSFVLTNFAGVKIYACALKFYEEITPLELISLFNHQTMQEKGNRSARKASLELPFWMEQYTSEQHLSPETIYSPKCLLLVSHFPHFSVLRKLVRHIYRIFRSPSPLPIERYIANFVGEIPVPPQGRIQVHVTLSDESPVLVSRPSRNQLPISDFAARALFQVLDIPHIITVFAHLLFENKIAFCSKHVGLLTPVAETFLALLLPFTWQGAYIPILPSFLLDVLDAPIPFVVGVHANYLRRPTPLRPTGVVLVDLDQNRIIPPVDEEGKEMETPRLPEKDLHKLVIKLQEYAKVFDPFAPEVNRIDKAFQTDEPVQPIATFATFQGMTIQNIESTRSSQQQTLHRSLSNRQTFTSSLSFKNNTSSSSSASASASASASGGHLSSSTLSFLTSPKNKAAASDLLLPHQEAQSLELDALVDASGNESEGFSFMEIRQAFLRFFTSIFKRYASFLKSKETLAESPRLSVFDVDSFLQKEYYTENATRQFMVKVMESQMFQRFCEDCVFDPENPQVRYFDEAIKQKLNRSMTLKKKLNTSYLDDTTEAIRETFVVPLPSHDGLLNKAFVYSYARFPRLKSELFGTLREVQQLYFTPDEQEQMAHLDFHQRVYLLTKEMHRKPAGAATWKDTVQSIVTIQAQIRCFCARRKYQRTLLATRRIQKCIRAIQRTRQCQDAFEEKRQACIFIQRRIRGYLTLKRYRQLHRECTRLQGYVRTFLIRLRYKKVIYGVIKIQSTWKKHRCAKTYRRIQAAVIQVQALLRGRWVFQSCLKHRKKLLKELRSQVFSLWQECRWPFTFRSQFWTVYTQPDYLTLGVYMEEKDRLEMYVKETCLPKSNQSPSPSPSHSPKKTRSTDDAASSSTICKASLKATPWMPPNVFSSSSFAFSLKSPTSRFSSSSLSLSSSPTGNSPGTPSLKPSWKKLKALTSPHKKSLSNEWFPFSFDVALEHKILYQTLKHRIAPDKKASFYQELGISERDKKKKQRLIDTLWQLEETADRCARIVNEIMMESQSVEINEWISGRRNMRIKGNLHSILCATLATLQKQQQQKKKTNRRIERCNVLCSSSPSVPSSDCEQKQLSQLKRQVRQLIRQNHVLEVTLAKKTLALTQLKKSSI